MFPAVINYLPRGKCLVVDTYRDSKRRDTYLALGTDPEGDSCFSIYQNNGIKIHFIFKEAILDKPFFLFLARMVPVISTAASKSTNVLDIASYGSQSERAKMYIGCFGKYYLLITGNRV